MLVLSNKGIVPTSLDKLQKHNLFLYLQNTDIASLF